ncbi:MAG: hypothetical protein Salg2KO_11580 [Salibacteraceae bacterium]
MSAIILALVLFGCQKTAPEALNETIYVERNGAKMPVYVRGNITSNKMIIVVHGGPGGNGLEYRSGVYSNMLEAEFAVAYWDQRGQGMSQGNYGIDAVSIDEMVDDLRAVVLTMKNAYNSDLQVFLLGHSWGGTLTSAFLVKDDNQSLCSGWIEADGAHDIPLLNIEAIKMFQTVGEEQIALGNSVDSWTEILDWAKGVDTNSIGIETGGEINSKAYEAEDLLFNDGILASGEFSVPDLFSPTNLLTSTISGNFTSGILTPEVEIAAYTDSLDQVVIPCLFLWGQYDFVVPPALGISALNKVSSTEKRLIIYGKSGHSPMSNEGPIFAQDIIDFINELN